MQQWFWGYLNEIQFWPTCMTFSGCWVIVDEVIGLVRLRKGVTYLFVSKTYFKFI
jgi:hypothetical protein